MILSASRRTDIPCFYSEWFMNRIRAGYVLTRNPMNHAQISRITLSPDVIDCIVFWTKDPLNMLPHLAELDSYGYNYYFQYTLTPYGRDLEPKLRDKSKIIETFIKLSEYAGKNRIVWRYDPIILNNNIDLEWHKTKFEGLCENLYRYTNKIIISFVDSYKKLSSPQIRPITDFEIGELAEFIGKTAQAYGLTSAACCEPYDLLEYGIKKSSCIAKTDIEAICKSSLDIDRDKNQRSGCECCQSIDIGAYNTCLNGCIYCYANNRKDTVLRKINAHNPESELIIGTIKEDEKISNRIIKSNKPNQFKIV